MVTVEEKPDVTYSDVGGCNEQIERLREVVELPLLSSERFVKLGIDPPKGCCYTFIVKRVYSEKILCYAQYLLIRRLYRENSESFVHSLRSFTHEFHSNNMAFKQ